MSLNLNLNRVTVICVTFESARLVPALACTLKRFAHVIVVDNASSDDTAARIGSAAPHATVIRNDRNLGFGAANNLALRGVRTEYALLLNPDCDIDEANLEILVATADRFDRAGLIAPQAYNGTRPQISYNNAYFEPIARFPYRVPDGVTCAKFLIACCLLVRVAAFEGRFFDERFFLYCEDDDLCLETFLRGYECIIEPAARVQHVGGGSSSKSLRVEYIKGFHRAFSRRMLVRKHVGPVADLKLRVRNLALAPFALLAYGLSLNTAALANWAGRIAQAMRSAR